MGLLDVLNSDQGRLGLSLLAAAGPSPVPQSFGQRLMGGMQAYQQQKDDEAMRAARTEQLGLLRLKQQMELEQIRRAQQFRDSLPSPQAMANQTALGGGGGPTMANAAKMPSIDPMLQQLHGAMKAGLIGPMEYLQATQPKAPDYKVVGDALLQVGPSGVKEAYRAPAKPEAMPSAVREYQFAQQQGYPGTFQQFQLEQKRAGATNLSVNTGDKIPASLVKQQDEIIDRITTARSTDADLAGVEGMLASGKLQFGPIRNLMNEGRNIAGSSTEESRAYGSFKSTLEKLRNDSLRLNAGVQTDGDAQRAWNELFQNINDTALVRQRLGEIRKINQRAAELQTYRLGVLRANSGAGPLDLPKPAPALGNSGSSSAGSLSPAEQAELESLRARLGGRR